MTVFAMMTGPGEARNARSLLLLDADGTIRTGPPGPDGRPGFVNGPDDVHRLDGAAARIAEHRETGGRVAIVSNQGGIPAGHTTGHAVAEAMAETIRALRTAAGERYADDPMVDVVVWCAHDGRPTDDEAGVREPCWCRKPGPGLLITAAVLCAQQHPGESYPLERVLMVGDREEDLGAATAAGVAFAWADEWRAGAGGGRA